MILRSLTIAVMLLGFSSMTPAIAESDDSADSQRSITECPGYANHLRIARAYLERSDRRNALFELKQARELLRECQAEQESESALASRAASHHAS